jgi:hypothetical protein
MSLETESFSSTPFQVRGIGASSKLVLDASSLEFGTFRLGTTHIKKIMLKNEGILRCNFYIECNLQCFSVEPEKGVLDGEGSVEVTVLFSPNATSYFADTIIFCGSYGEGYKVSPVALAVLGYGSYPELNVLTNVVDFGTALFNLDNVGQILIENSGMAEAQVEFKCFHPGIKLDATSIAGNTTSYVNIVYHPTIIETLDIKVFIKSSDSRGDYLMVRLRGIVGIPKLVMEPSDIFENFDFGVCPTNQLHVKYFRMKNEGNIPLSFISELHTIYDRAIVNEEFLNTAYKQSDLPTINIEPTRGDLPVGEYLLLKISFVPSAIAEYSYMYHINYDFTKLEVELKGTGGQAIISAENHLQFIDFGTCRLDRVFKKQITLTNSGNLGVNYIMRPEPADKDWSIYDLDIENLNTRHQESRPTTAKYASKSLEILAPELELEMEPEMELVEPNWVKALAALGFRMPNPNAFSLPYHKSDMLVEFKPTMEKEVMLKLRIFVEGGFSEEFEVRGRAVCYNLVN